MAEYLIQEETLIGIADEVRTLSGETKNLTTTEIKSNISTANNTINTQANLIAQIQTALEGKAAGGGGGASVETCTVTISFQSGINAGIVATIKEDNNIVPYINADGGSLFTVENIVCGSAVYIVVGSLAFVGATTDGGVERYGNLTTPAQLIFKAPTESNATGSIIIYNND